MERSRFVSAINGQWVDGNGKTLYITGVDYWSSGLPYQEEFSGQAPCEYDLLMYKRMGFNTMRVPINWRYLEKEYGRFDPAYLRILQNIRDWCRQYELYYIVDLHLTQPATTPAWMKDFDYIASPEGMQHLLKVWRYLARIFVDEEYCIGYEVPGNEVGDRPQGGVYLDRHLPDFNNWLSKKYANNQPHLSNRWWSAGISDGPARERLLKNHWSNPVLADRNDFYSSKLKEIIAAVIKAIRESDPNHLFIIQNAQGYGPGIMAYEMNYTNLESLGVAGSGDHLYPAHWNNGRPSLDTPAVSTKAYPVAHFSAFLLSGMATYNGETCAASHEASVWEFNMYMTQLFRMGVGGFLWWSSRRSESTDDFDLFYPDYKLKPQAQTLPMLAKAWKLGKPERINPQVAVIIETVADDESDNNFSLLGLGDILGGMHADYIYLPAKLVERNPAILNNFKGVIADQGKLRNSVRQIIREYSQTGGHLLLLGACIMNEYREAATVDDLYENWVFRERCGGTVRERYQAGRTELLMQIEKDFGGLPAGASVQSIISDWGLNPVALNGLCGEPEIIISTDAGKKAVYWRMGNTFWYIDWLKPVLTDDRFLAEEPEKYYLPGETVSQVMKNRCWSFPNIQLMREIVKDFCQAAGVATDVDTPESITYAYNRTGYILLENSPCTAYKQESTVGDTVISLDARRLGVMNQETCAVFDVTGELAGNNRTVHYKSNYRKIADGITALDGKFRFIIDLKEYDLRLLKAVRQDCPEILMHTAESVQVTPSDNNRVRLDILATTGSPVQIAMFLPASSLKLKYLSLPANEADFCPGNGILNLEWHTPNRTTIQVEILLNV